MNHKTIKSSLRFNFIIFTFILCLFSMINQCESRHLPTRGQEDNLEKLRELMYQILESSNENVDDRRSNSNSYSSPSSSWSKQNLFDSGIPPQLLMSSKSRYSHNNNNNNFDNLRMY